MKKIIIASLLLSTLIFEPIVGDLLSSYFNLKDGTIILMVLVWIFSAVFRLIMYGTIMVQGYRETGITTMFDE